MGFTDKKITCADCNAEFTFGTVEQEFYASKGFTNEPKRCPDCRQARKSDRQGNGSGQRGRRQMFATVCAKCGKDTEVPFEPRQDKPVYCSDCYSVIKLSK
ncbi:MAG: zinc-ribbon domain containing protein [Chloroflexi bacterium]|nr:zinc-ribbon domain containing protein [Chloroflexota bacterium]